MNETVKRDMDQCQQLLNKAIHTHGIDDWRAYKHYRNTLNKHIKTLKKEHIRKQFKEANNKYKYLKNYNKSNKQNVPNIINDNNIKVTSPKKLSEIANNFFINKINKIKSTFTKTQITPIQILSKLRPRVNEKLEIPPIKQSEMIKIIISLKNSNCTGHDDISNKIIKKLTQQIAPHLCHLINSIIITEIFPDIYKISRILPLSKPGLPTDLIKNYRPIHNLPTIEKIIETYLMIHINKHLEKHNILSDKHHGGRRGHSTMTALTMIYNKLLYNKENSIISTILCTDLSAAYDTVDTDILLEKLQYYGFEGKILNILKSYYENRKQYVNIDTFNSLILECPRGGVIQGGKTSGTMYNLYVNEVTEIYKLIYDPIFKDITGKNTQYRYSKIEHLTINYVDDSNNVISTKDHSHIKHYVEDYYLLLHNFYNINRLKINRDKNRILLIYPNKLENIFKNFQFKAQNYIIKRSDTIKILGTYIQKDLKLDREIMNLSSQLHNRIFNLRKIQKYTDFKTRFSFIN